MRAPPRDSVRSLIMQRDAEESAADILADFEAFDGVGDIGPLHARARRVILKYAVEGAGSSSDVLPDGLVSLVTADMRAMLRHSPRLNADPLLKEHARILYAMWIKALSGADSPADDSIPQPATLAMQYMLAEGVSFKSTASLALPYIYRQFMQLPGVHEDA